jgi:hypothetical protein
MKYQSVTLSGAHGSVMMAAEPTVGGTAVRINGNHPIQARTENRTDTFGPGQLAEATLHAAKLIYGRRHDGYADCTNSETYEVRDLLQRLGLGD